MAFVRKKVASYKWPVKVESPSPDSAGKFDIDKSTDQSSFGGVGTHIKTKSQLATS